MSIRRNLIYIIVLALGLVGWASCDGNPRSTGDVAKPESSPKSTEAAYQPAAPEIAEYRAKGLPMLLDFGMGFCIPCKKMAPDLTALHTELAGRVLVRFNDLRKEEALAQEYRIRVMPTQVYLDGNGREVARHEGYASKDEMTAKMEALGFFQ